MAKIREIYDNTIKDNGNRQVIYPITKAQAVYTDTNQKIQDLLNEGYRFGGLAKPNGVPSVKQRIFYVAATPGYYPNYGGLTIDGGESAFLLCDGTTWEKVAFSGTGNKNLTGYKTLADISLLPDEESTLGYLIDNNLYVWVGEGGDTAGGKYENCGPLNGESAYGIAVQQGFSGTEEEWLESLVGPTGKSAYQSAVDNGFEGTEAEWVYLMTKAPDEEDITTSANNLLKFADRPTAVNQMGYVILRKNKTFAEQVTQANTIYEIRYAFDLGGESITLPDNCVLNFSGGFIDNGTLSGAQTRINADIVHIFGDSLTVVGSWNANFSYPEWFGAKPNVRTYDSAQAINKALSLRSANLSLTTHIPCVLRDGRYYVYSSIQLNGSKILHGSGIGQTLLNGASDSANPVVKILGQQNEISDISIWGNVLSSEERNRNGLELGESDYSVSATRGVIKNISFRFCDICLAAYNQWCNHIEKIQTSVSNIGVFAGKTQCELISCVIEGCSEAGISAGSDMSLLSIIGGVIEGNKIGVIFNGGIANIENCYFEGNTESSINENAEKDSAGVDVNGGHIIAGSENKIQALTVSGCHFSNASFDNNKIYVDKCMSFSFACPPKENYTLITTSNTVVNSLPSENTVQVFSAGTVAKKSSIPFFSITDFSDFTIASANRLNLVSRYYCTVYSNLSTIRVNGDGSIDIYRTAEQSNRLRFLEVQFREPIFSGCSDFFFVIEYQINKVNVKPSFSASLTINGVDTSFYSSSPNLNLGVGRRQRAIIPVHIEDLGATSAVFARIQLSNDAFVSETDDLMAENRFSLFGFYLYCGDAFAYNGDNIFPVYSRLSSRRVIAESGVVFQPLSTTPAYPEKGMVVFDESLGKLKLYNGTTWVNTDGSALS